MGQIGQSRKNEALRLLKNLAECLFSLNADIFYETLKDSGFSEVERTRLVGSCFRVAASRRWVTRTDFSTKSRRNSSNLQSVWVSRLFPSFAKSGLEAEKKIQSAYSYWESNKLAPPDDLAEKWQER